MENVRLKNNFFFYEYIKNLKKILGTMIKDIRIQKKDIEIKTTQANLKGLLYFLKNHTLCLYKQLSEIICIDQPKNKLRFTIIYKLYSVHYQTHLYINVQTNEVISIPSVNLIYSSANWLEREVWDLFGIFFSEHIDLRRILTDYGFQGHPLRKDFPLTGFFELYYNDSKKRIITEPVELTQEYRVFTFQDKLLTEKQSTDVKD